MQRLEILHTILLDGEFTSWCFLALKILVLSYIIERKGIGEHFLRVWHFLITSFVLTLPIKRSLRFIISLIKIITKVLIDVFVCQLFCTSPLPHESILHSYLLTDTLHHLLCLLSGWSFIFSSPHSRYFIVYLSIIPSY